MREAGERGAQVGAGIVPEGLDIGMAIECRLNHPALNTPPAPMNDTHLAKAGGRGGAHVLLDDRRHVARREGVQVDFRFDRNPDHEWRQYIKPNT